MPQKHFTGPKTKFFMTNLIKVFFQVDEENWDQQISRKKDFFLLMTQISGDSFFQFESLQ
jgi:hypothetical protein